MDQHEIAIDFFNCQLHNRFQYLIAQNIKIIFAFEHHKKHKKLMTKRKQLKSFFLLFREIFFSRLRVDKKLIKSS